MTATSSHEAPPDSDARAARRFAVLGLGRIGLGYAMSIAMQSGLSLAGFAEPRAPLRRFAQGAGFRVPAAATLPRLLEMVEADAIVVAAPAEERVAAVEAALASGRAVLIDGLPSPHAEGAARLAPALVRRDATVGCAFGLLFHPLFARARRLIAAGALGPLRELRASVNVSRVFAPDAPPQRGDAIDFCLAELLVLLDAMFGPALAVGATANHLFGERIDEVHARLGLAGGAEVIVDASWSVPGYPHASIVIEVRADRGALLVSDDALEANLEAPFESLPAGQSRRVLAEEPDPVAFETGAPARALEAFVPALRGAPVPDALSAARALRVVALVDAVRRSVATGGAVRELAR
ncbi:MAG TPA: Gfo/Idh/MocA family oxidoreductase [Candidatus Acidoferrales bacterium]|nr:Gfo/Idh/MocA family oxidoreductase [Candidatus Acidoferrales bacterium]